MERLEKDLAASLNGSQGVITWSPVDLEGVKYYLYRAEKMSDGTAANSVRLAELSNPGYTDTHLEAGKTYLYNVVVAKDGKDVSMSNFTQLTVTGAAQPAEPAQPQTPNVGGSVQPGTGQQPTNPSTPSTPGNGQPANQGGTTPAPTTPTPSNPNSNGNMNQPNPNVPVPGGVTPPAQPGSSPSTPAPQQ